jgi:hypothetical protein
MGLCVFYFHTKFHMLSSYHSLGITKSKGKKKKKKFRNAAIFLDVFYVSCFPQDLLPSVI